MENIFQLVIVVRSINPGMVHTHESGTAAY
jgi:hypothetical protein